MVMKELRLRQAVTSAVSCGFARAGGARARWVIQQRVPPHSSTAAAAGPTARERLFFSRYCGQVVPRAAPGRRQRRSLRQSSVFSGIPRSVVSTARRPERSAGAPPRRLSRPGRRSATRPADFSSLLRASCLRGRPASRFGPVFVWGRPAGSLRPPQHRHFRIPAPDAARQVSLTSRCRGIQPEPLRAGSNRTTWR